MRSALGKGLDALISQDTVENVSAPPKNQAPLAVAIERIHPNPKQPRKVFTEQALAELVASVKRKGIIQPLVVSPLEGGTFEIIAGERRWRAAQRAGLKEVPVVVRTGSEAERFEMALIENLQREDLNPIELAEGFKRLQDEFGLTQEAIANVVGKDRAVVANTLRLLGLTSDIQQALSDGKITAGHGRALAALEDKGAQQTLFRQILANQLTVRHVEHAVREHKKNTKPEHLRAAGYDGKTPEIRAIEENLQQILARKIDIRLDAASSQKGSIKLEFYSLDDFDALVSQLKK